MAGGIRLLVVAVAVVVASLLPAPALRTAEAQAAEPGCAETVLDDWSDGRIDGTYERECYLEAIALLPEDVRAYTSAADDIARALQSRGGTRAAAGPSAAEAPVGVSDTPVATESSRGLPASVVLLVAIAVAVLAAGSAGLVARRLRVRRGP